MPLKIVLSDITKMHVDAIVNTTNEEMIGYSGVDLAVHKAAGPLLDKECATVAPLGLGEAKATGAYGLCAKYIIHTSGPVWYGGLRGESIILRSCYTESLKLAERLGCESVAFPLISSGAYGYPKDRVLKYAVEIITEFLYESELDVYLCVYDRESYAFSRVLFDDINSFINSDIDTNSCIRDTGKTSSVDNSAPFEEGGEEPLNAEVIADFGTSPRRAQAEVKDSLPELHATLGDYLKTMEKTFAYKLFELIDERGMTDVECYKRANVDKKTFSKIKCRAKTYKPSKETAVAFALALRLDLEGTQELLATAGITLSGSLPFDKVIRYYLNRGVYDIQEINQSLFEFDLPLLGSF